MSKRRGNFPALVTTHIFGSTIFGLGIFERIKSLIFFFSSVNRRACQINVTGTLKGFGGTDERTNEASSGDENEINLGRQ